MSRYTQRLIEQLDRRNQAKLDKVPYIYGILGANIDGQDRVEVPGRPGYVYVRIRDNLSDLAQVYNDAVSPVYGLPVIVGKDYIDPTRYRIMGRDLGRYQNWGYSAYVPRHAAQHEFNPKGPGGDIVWTYKQQIVPLLVHPSGTQGAPNVVIEPDLYYYYDRWIYAGGTGTPSLLTCKPSGGGNARMALVQLDKDGNPVVTCGDTEFPDTVTGSAQVSPYIPGLVDSMNIPLAAIRLVTGTSVILWRNIYDARGLVGQMTSTGTSSTPISGHIIAQDGVGVTQRPILNFEGPIVFVSDDPLNDRTDIVISGASGHVIQDDGADQIQRNNLNFIGDTFVVYDDNANDATIVSGTASGVSGAPDDAEYLTLALNGTLSDERVFTPGDGLAGTDGGAGSTYTLNVDISPLGDVGTPDAGDLLIIEDITDGSIKRVNWSEIGISTTSRLLIYDDSVFKVTGSAISFDDYLYVSVTGSIAYVNTSGSLGGVSNFVDLDDVDSPFGDDEILYWEDNAVRGDPDFTWDEDNYNFDASQGVTQTPVVQHCATFGESQTVTGLGNILAGLANNVDGNRNAVFGANNVIESGYSIVSGYLNTIAGGSNSSYNALFGEKNNIANNSAYNIVAGYNNDIMVGGDENAVFGTYNEVYNAECVILGTYSGEIHGYMGVLIGGNYGILAGDHCLGYGNYPIVSGTGAMVFADGDYTSSVFLSTTNNEFAVRARGGFRFVTDVDGGGTPTYLLGVYSGAELRFYEGANYVGFEPPALTANQIWVLPDADGNANEVLTTDGGGNLSWTEAGSAENTLLIYDDSIFKVTGTTISFDDNLAVHVTGSVAFVDWTGSFASLPDVDDPLENDEVLYWDGSKVEGYTYFLWDDTNKSLSAGEFVNPYGSEHSASFGYINRVSGSHNIIAGGSSTIRGDFNAALGGNLVISGTYSFVAGAYNEIKGGYDNAILGGFHNQINGGQKSSILGGEDNRITSDYSAVFGRKARALHDGVVILSDDTDQYFDSIQTNEFAARFPNGFRFVAGLNATGTPAHTVYILPTGTVYAKDIVVSGSLIFEEKSALLTSPIPGTLEYYNDRLYLTNVGTQRPIDRTSDVVTGTSSVSNTTVETTIYTGIIGANDLKVGNVLKAHVSGLLSNNSASDNITIRGYIGSTLLGTFNPAIGNVTDEVWDVDAILTVRSLGAAGDIAWLARFEIAGNDTVGTDISSVNTTISEDFTITVEWNSAKAGNTISIYQGFMEFKN